MPVIGAFADVVTLLAALVTAFGLLSAFLARPRVEIQASGSGFGASIVIRLRKGMNPIRSLRMSWATIDERDVAWSGDGDEHAGLGLQTALYPDQHYLISVYSEDEVQFSDPPRAGELRLGLSAGMGFIMDLNWQRPFLRWLRTHRYVRWRPTDRAQDAAPVVLRKHQGQSAFRAVMASSRRLMPPAQ